MKSIKRPRETILQNPTPPCERWQIDELCVVLFYEFNLQAAFRRIRDYRASLRAIKISVGL